MTTIINRVSDLGLLMAIREGTEISNDKCKHHGVNNIVFHSDSHMCYLLKLSPIKIPKILMVH